MKKNSIFDMDGVIFDTEGAKADAHVAVICSLGLRAKAEWYLKVIGQDFETVATNFIDKSKAQIGLPRYRWEFNRAYKALIKDIRNPTYGAINLIETIRKFDIKTALVTSSEKWMMNDLLQRSRMTDCFDIQVCSEDVKEEKPDPEPYLVALRELKAKAEESIVFEDTPAGIKSAKRAGIDVIAIRHKYNRRLDLSMANAEFSSLEKCPLEWFKSQNI